MNARFRGIALGVGTTAAAVLGLITPPPAMGAIEPYVGVAITFERGCPQGEGTLEVVNETTGVDVIRGPVLWGRDGKLRWQAEAFTWETYPITTYASIRPGDDRLVIRLLSADGRLLFTSEVPFFPEPEEFVDGPQPPDYWLAVRLDCSRIPYRVAAQLPWPPYMPATSTAPAPPESPPVPLILVATFGLALVGGWRYTSGCRRRSI